MAGIAGFEMDSSASFAARCLGREFSARSADRRAPAGGDAAWAGVLWLGRGSSISSENGVVLGGSSRPLVRIVDPRREMTSSWAGIFGLRRGRRICRRESPASSANRRILAGSDVDSSGDVRPWVGTVDFRREATRLGRESSASNANRRFPAGSGAVWAGIFGFECESSTSGGDRRREARGAGVGGITTECDGWDAR